MRIGSKHGAHFVCRRSSKGNNIGNARLPLRECTRLIEAHCIDRCKAFDGRQVLDDDAKLGHACHRQGKRHRRKQHKSLRDQSQHDCRRMAYGIGVHRLPLQSQQHVYYRDANGQCKRDLEEPVDMPLHG